MGFEYRRLLVHQKVLEYRALAAPLLVRIKLVDVDLHNQRKRNGNSMGSNIAEGASEDRPKVKPDRYRIAKREVEEAAMNWESAAASGYVNVKKTDALLQLLDEIARMLAADPPLRSGRQHQTKGCGDPAFPSPFPYPSP